MKSDSSMPVSPVNARGTELSASDARERERLERILEGIKDDFVMYDDDWRYVYVNGQAAQSLGYTKEQLIGQRVWDLFPEAVGNHFYRELVRAKAEGRNVTFEHYYEPLGKWIENRAYPIPNGMLLFSTDITERKRAEEALQATQHRFAMFMQNLPGLAWIKDAEGRYVYANAAAEIAFRKSKAELYGRTDEEVFPPETAALFRQNDRLALAGGTGFQTIEALEQEDGVHHSIVSKFPILGPDGRAVMVGGVAIDITERKQAEQRLIAQYKITQILSEAATLEEATPRILQAMCEHLAWDLGALWSIDEEAGVLRHVRSWHKSSIEVPQFETISRDRTFQPGEGLPGRVWASREPAYIADVAQDANFPRAPIAAREGLHAAFGFPVLLCGEVLGVMEFFSHEIKQPDEDLLNLMATVGSQIGQFIERKRAEQALRESEADARFFAELGERIRLASNAEDLFYELSYAAGDYLNVQRCFFVEIDEANDRGMVRRDYCRGVESVAGEYSLSEYSPIARAEISGGHTIVNTDSRTDPRTATLYETSYGPRGERAYVAVPLMREGRWSGAFWASTDQPRRWQPREIALLETVAERGWNAVEQLRLDAELRKSEERFRTLANNMSQLAWTCDELGSATWYNRRWYEYTGSTWEQMRGEGWKSVHHPGHLERVVATLNDSLTSGQAWEDTFPLRGKDGQYRWFLSRAIPIRDAAGKIASWFGTNTDVTEQRAAEEALRETDRRKDEFLAMLAHELRNPLAPIRNAARVLKLVGPADANQQWAREVIERQTQHLTRLVDDLLDVSRITQGKITLAREPVELAMIVNRAVETSRPAIDACRHQLTVVLPPEPVRLEGDLTRLVQVVGNLLNNAAKYTDEGGRIRVEASAENGEAVIRVRDNGIGVPADLLPHVFDLFTQADRSLDRSQGGLGIGLTLVRQLVEMHGGRVEAQSGGPGRGSEFIVRLPALPIADRGSRIADGFSNPQSLTRDPQLRVLVVEDNVDSAEMMAFMLKFGGHEVRVARDGVEALKVARAFRPQVVLCDIGLPKMNGYEVAAQLRAQPDFERTRLVALTGYGQEEDLRRAREAGFDVHLVKPVDPDALDALLDSMRSENG